MKVCTVIGARPQFIKASAVTRQFSKNGIEEHIVHTGQHFDTNMSSNFLQSSASKSLHITSVLVVVHMGRTQAEC